MVKRKWRVIWLSLLTGTVVMTVIMSVVVIGERKPIERLYPEIAHAEVSITRVKPGSIGNNSSKDTFTTEENLKRIDLTAGVIEVDYEDMDMIYPEEVGELGDSGLLDLYNEVTGEDNLQIADSNNLSGNVNEILFSKSRSELKANSSLESIDKKRVTKAREEREYKAYIESLFEARLMTEMDNRQKERNRLEQLERQKSTVTAQGSGLQIMYMTEEMNFIKKAMSSSPQGNTNEHNLIYEMMPYYLGKPYIWGGDDRTTKGVGYDCSGFTLSVLNKLGKRIPRVSAMQFNSGKSVEVSDLQVGDLVFFHTGDGFRVGVDVPSKVSHVGLYIGKGMMVHASSGSNKIRTEKVFSNYFAPRYMGAKRY